MGNFDHSNATPLRWERKWDTAFLIGSHVPKTTFTRSNLTAARHARLLKSEYLYPLHIILDYPWTSRSNSTFAPIHLLISSLLILCHLLICSNVCRPPAESRVSSPNRELPAPGDLGMVIGGMTPFVPRQSVSEEDFLVEKLLPGVESGDDVIGQRGGHPAEDVVGPDGGFAGDGCVGEVGGQAVREGGRGAGGSVFGVGRRVRRGVEVGGSGEEMGKSFRRGDVAQRWIQEWGKACHLFCNTGPTADECEEICPSNPCVAGWEDMYPKWDGDSLIYATGANLCTMIDQRREEQRGSMQEVVMLSGRAVVMHELKHVNNVVTTSLLMGSLSTTVLRKPLHWHRG
ncbi:hypothetical protein KC331_g14 [Hortaea werneckii]|nr:hypothetical protein KC331_g14 [Hortaea werneckii]